MRKFLLKIILTIAILALNSTNAIAFYDDVPEEYEYYPSIKALYDMGRLPEEPENLFRPEDLLKKAELYKLIIVFAQADLSPEVNLPFIDTQNSADYAAYIQTAIDLGILEPIGTGPPELFPTQTVAKHSALSKMFKILGIGTSFFFDKENFAFSDLNPNSKTATIAAKAFNLGIVEKDKPEQFKMAKRIKRSEAADYLYKIYQYSPTSPQIRSTTINVTLNDSSINSDITENKTFATFLDIWESLQDNYLYKDQLDNDQLIYGAIQGMVDQLDDEYTVFQKPETAVSLLNSLSGDYEGIGIIIEIIDNNITIISPFKNSPAEEAGLKANDIIIKVNGESVVGASIDTVASKIKGPAGSTVKITVLRNNQEQTFTVTREFILISTIESEMLHSGTKDIGYISILSFNDDTYEKLVQAATELLTQNPDGFIIDLRNNPGGYLDVAVNMIGLFTGEIKTAVTLKYGDGSEEFYKTNGNGLLANYEMVVLVNEGSASAAEIMAGTLQDYKIATLIGTQTFGKGSVQELKQYDDNSLFKYTISKWITPSGQEINGIGLTPDKIVENQNGDSDDEQLNAALAEF